MHRVGTVPRRLFSIIEGSSISKLAGGQTLRTNLLLCLPVCFQPPISRGNWLGVIPKKKSKIKLDQEERKGGRDRETRHLATVARCATLIGPFFPHTIQPRWFFHGSTTLYPGLSVIHAAKSRLGPSALNGEREKRFSQCKFSSLVLLLVLSRVIAARVLCRSST